MIPMFKALLKETRQIFEAQEYLFDVTTAPQIVDRLNKELGFPYVHAQYSTLGGNENVSIMVTISLDAREDWFNGILQNSRYANFHIDRLGTVERFSGGRGMAKFRKTRIKSIEDLFPVLKAKVAPEKVQETKVTTPDLASVDIDKLDPIERRWFDKYSKLVLTKEEALQIIINTIEGDWSQLSPELRVRAEKDTSFSNESEERLRPEDVVSHEAPKPKKANTELSDEEFAKLSMQDQCKYNIKNRCDRTVVKESHSHSKCMDCDAKPTVEVLWAEGKGHAWFCDKCFAVWKTKDGKGDIVSVKAIQDGEAAKKFADNKNPNMLKEDGSFLVSPQPRPPDVPETPDRSDEFELKKRTSPEEDANVETRNKPVPIPFNV
jgi:hypothetical protein